MKNGLALTLTLALLVSVLGACFVEVAVANPYPFVIYHQPPDSPPQISLLSPTNIYITRII